MASMLSRSVMMRKSPGSGPTPAPDSPHARTRRAMTRAAPWWPDCSRDHSASSGSRPPSRAHRHGIVESYAQLRYLGGANVPRGLRGEAGATPAHHDGGSSRPPLGRAEASIACWSVKWWARRASQRSCVLAASGGGQREVSRRRGHRPVLRFARSARRSRLCVLLPKLDSLSSAIRAALDRSSLSSGAGARLALMTPPGTPARIKVPAWPNTRAPGQHVHVVCSPPDLSEYFVQSARGPRVPCSPRCRAAPCRDRIPRDRPSRTASASRSRSPGYRRSVRAVAPRSTACRRRAARPVAAVRLAARARGAAATDVQSSHQSVPDRSCRRSTPNRRFQVGSRRPARCPRAPCHGIAPRRLMAATRREFGRASLPDQRRARPDALVVTDFAKIVPAAKRRRMVHAEIAPSSPVISPTGFPLLDVTRHRTASGSRIRTLAGHRKRPRTGARRRRCDRVPRAPRRPQTSLELRAGRDEERSVASPSSSPRAFRLRSRPREPSRAISETGEGRQLRRVELDGTGPPCADRSAPKRGASFASPAGRTQFCIARRRRSARSAGGVGPPRRGPRIVRPT